MREISRRNFMTGALTAGAAAAVAGIAGFAPQAQAAETENAIEWTQEADIVIVGCGASGTAAALSAAENGASVIVLESTDHMGGSGALCAGAILGVGTKMQADAGIEDDPEVLIENTRDSIVASYGPEELDRIGDDWAITELHCREAGNTVDWMCDHGIEFVGPSQQPGQPCPRLHMMYPNSSVWPSVILPQVEEAGVDIKFETKAAELIVEDGCVVGVMAEDGSCYKGNKGIIMAAASIENSPEWRKKIYSIAESNVQAANPNNDGSGIRMMCKVGADTTEYTAAAAGPALFCTAGNAGHWYGRIITTGGAIFVDPNGKRFASEDLTANQMMLTVDALPDRRSFVVWDNTIAQIPELATEDSLTLRGVGYGPVSGLEEQGKIFVGDTIEEVAEAAGIDPAGLAEEIEKYNASVVAGVDEDFGRENFGVLTEGIIEPPYRILGPVYATVMSASFGVCVTDKHQVKDTFGRIIPGLYATGESAHGLAKDFLTGAGGKISWAWTSGRLCGARLATIDVEEEAQAVAAVNEEAAQVDVAPAEEAAVDCTTCHVDGREQGDPNPHGY